MLRLPNHYYNPRCYWAHMITFNCNGGCKFCILNGRGKASHPKLLTGQEILSFWNNLLHSGGQKLSLIGGEPYLHPDILEIIGNLKNYKLTITTNCASPIHKTPNFYKILKPGPGSTLRINTSFHPHLISAEEYIGVIRKYREAKHYVDQIAFVNYPGVENQYKDELTKVRKAFGLRRVPYLGFWNKNEGPNATANPKTIEPNENYVDPKAAARICGLHDLEAYRDICGAAEKREAVCTHPPLSLIIGPQGNYYHCHYKLYYDIDPVCNIKNFKPISADAKLCRHYGFCNWCDVPRVGCIRNRSVRPLTIANNDKTKNTSEVQYLISRMKSLAKEKRLKFYEDKWFYYTKVLLWTGHRHSGKVVVVGEPGDSVWMEFLKLIGYKVNYIEDSYKNIFSVSTCPEWRADMICSVGREKLRDVKDDLKSGGIAIHEFNGKITVERK